MEHRLAGVQAQAAEQWEGRSGTDCEEFGLPITKSFGFFLQAVNNH